ncbi:TPA: hypothetical protein DEP21_06090 [Patescibacteria group bacterium]|nr:hypothetical protein [Candidatus Gracilibacteria bacterium]
MIYETKTDQERNHIETFLKKENAQSYFILLTVRSEEDKSLIKRQIFRSNLSDVNWLITSPEDFDVVIKNHKNIGRFVVAELTMTGNKNNVYNPHNWEMLTIDHSPRTDPFDEVFTKTINLILDQVLYNFSEEKRTHKTKIRRLLLDFMESGMFAMQSDPKKRIGT